MFLTLALFSSKASAVPTFVDDFSVNSQEDEPRGLTFNNDGTKMFVIGWEGDDVNEYTLGTAWDVSTASFVDSTDRIDNDARDVKFNPDGTKMFVLGENKKSWVMNKENASKLWKVIQEAGDYLLG